MLLRISITLASIFIVFSDANSPAIAGRLATKRPADMPTAGEPSKLAKTGV